MASKLTWLGERPAHPDIGRYFAAASEEIVQILQDIARENAFPSDDAGVAIRMTGMVTRLNEIDPDYTFDFTIAERRTCHIVPTALPGRTSRPAYLV